MRTVDRSPTSFSATPCAVRTPTMSKKKRAQKAKLSNTTTAWSDLEQAFFAAAPPDEPEPATEALSFDDLGPVAAARGMPPWLKRTLDEVGRLGTAISSRLDRRTITVALATVMLLIGLSAAVFARH